MYYRSPAKPKLAVLYLREAAALGQATTADAQEQLCRKYCDDRKLPVSHSVHVCCDGSASLDVLCHLLRTLPEEVDTLVAANFLVYSPELLRLGPLCCAFQCRRIWLYSVEHVSPLCYHLPTINHHDILNADRCYQRILRFEPL